MDTLEKAGEGLVIRRVALDALHLDPSNAREHGDRNLETIRASLTRFGQAEPLVVHKGTGRVIGGNGRLVAMRDLGWSECDVVEVAGNEVTATALGIALNRTAELADWDMPTLGSLLESLRAEGALEGVGYSEAELDDLLNELGGNAEKDVDDPGAEDPPETPVSRSGELWVLGEHRLLCGDSTALIDVQRVMDGVRTPTADYFQFVRCNSSSRHPLAVFRILTANLVRITAPKAFAEST